MDSDEIATIDDPEDAAWVTRQREIVIEYLARQRCDHEDPETGPASEIGAFQPSFDKKAQDDHRHGKNARVSQEIGNVVSARSHGQPVCLHFPLVDACNRMRQLVESFMDVFYAGFISTGAVFMEMVVNLLGDGFGNSLHRHQVVQSGTRNRLGGAEVL